MPFINGPAGSLYRLRKAANKAARLARADIQASSPLYEHESLARIEALVALADTYIDQIHCNTDFEQSLHPHHQ